MRPWLSDPSGVHGEAIAAIDTLRRDLDAIELRDPTRRDLTLLAPFDRVLDAIEGSVRNDWEYRLHQARTHFPIMMPNGEIR